MDWFRCSKQTRLEHRESRWKFSIYRNISSTRDGQPDNNSKSHRDPKCDRHHFNFQQLKYLLLILLNANVLFPTAVRSADVGGVSATANPVANSSGSVTNQAIQVLQGPYITNTYGDGISCQGPTLNITPFLTDSVTAFNNPKSITIMILFTTFLMPIMMESPIIPVPSCITYPQELDRKISSTLIMESPPPYQYHLMEDCNPDVKRPWILELPTLFN